MIDYIAWLLDKSEEETEAAPALDAAGGLSLSARRRAADREDVLRDDPAAFAAKEAAALQEKTVSASLPLYEKQRQGARAALHAAEAATGGTPGFISGRQQRDDAVSADLREASRAAAETLYTRLRKSRNEAEGVSASAARRGATHSEPISTTGSLSLDPIALDRCFERDARRYDSGAAW